MMIFILLLNVDGGCSLGWPLWKTTDTRLSAGCGTPDKIDVARDASDWRRCFEDGGVLGGCSLGPIHPVERTRLSAWCGASENMDVVVRRCAGRRPTWR